MAGSDTAMRADVAFDWAVSNSLPKDVSMQGEARRPSWSMPPPVEGFTEDELDAATAAIVVVVVEVGGRLEKVLFFCSRIEFLLFLERSSTEK